MIVNFISEILVHPTSQTICRGENGTLACRVRGIGGWRINQTTLVPSNQALFRARGFTAEVNESRGREENEIFTTLTMVVEGRVQNNNTRFICYSVSVDGEVSVSNGAFLVIAGEKSSAVYCVLHYWIIWSNLTSARHADSRDLSFVLRFLVPRLSTAT